MWLSKIVQEESKSIVFGLAGTKADLPEESRKISREEVELFCILHSIDVHFEISSKENTMIEELFQHMVDTMVASVV